MLADVQRNEFVKSPELDEPFLEGILPEARFQFNDNGRQIERIDWYRTAEQQWPDACQPTH